MDKIILRFTSLVFAYPTLDANRANPLYKGFQSTGGFLTAAQLFILSQAGWRGTRNRGGITWLKNPCEQSIKMQLVFVLTLSDAALVPGSSTAALLPCSVPHRTCTPQCHLLLHPPTPAAPVHLPVCSLKQLRAPLTHTCPGSQVPCMEIPSLKSQGLTKQLAECVVAFYIPGCVWGLEFLSRQVQAACSSSLPALTLLGRRECWGRLSSSRGES